MCDSPAGGTRPITRRKVTLSVVIFTLLFVMLPSYSAADEGVATWYGQPFHGRVMANGQIYDMNDPTTTAANLWPFGTWVKVTNPANGKSVTVQVRDRGAFKHALDLSYAAFAAIDNPAKMLIRIQYEVVSGPDGAPVPKPASPPPATAPAPAATSAQPAVPSEYKVAPGDTLYAIGRRFNLGPDSLAKWNDLANPDHLKAGQTLTLKAPAAGQTAAPPSTRGAASAPAAAPTAAQAPNYVVAAGDTLWDIAAKFDTSPERLADLNGLADGNAISIGQRLRLPSSAAAPGSDGATRTLSGQYVVQPGDGLFGIALRHGTTVSALIQANGLSDPDLLRIGQTLAIP